MLLLVFMTAVAIASSRGTNCGNEPVLKLVPLSDGQGKAFTLEPKLKNINKKSLSGAFRLFLDERASIDSIRLGLYVQFHPLLGDSVREVRANFADNVPLGNATLTLANGTRIEAFLNDQGQFCGLQRHFTASGLWKITSWAYTSESWTMIRPNMTLFSSQTKEGQILASADFKEAVVCKTINQKLNLALECSNVDLPRQFFIDGFLDGSKVTANCQQRFSILLSDLFTSKDRDAAEQAEQTDIQSWLNGIEDKSYLLHSYKRVEANLLSKMDVARITLEAPECSVYKEHAPKYAEILMDEQIVFKGPVDYDTATGVASITIGPKNELFSSILESNQKLAPFQFNLYFAKPAILLNDETRYEKFTLSIIGHICQSGFLCGLITRYGQRLRKSGIEDCSLIHQPEKLTYVGFHEHTKGQLQGSKVQILIGGSLIYHENTISAYIYPPPNDFAIVGTFDEYSHLKSGQKARIEIVKTDPNGMMLLTFSKPVDTVVYHYKPPSELSFGDQPTIQDELASEWVNVEFMGGFKGDGIVAKKDIPKDTMFAQYGGYRMKRHRALPNDIKMPGTPYRHNIGICKMVLDFPIGLVDVQRYNGTLAHKCNHSFKPNMKHSLVDSARYGLVGAFITTKPIKMGEEIFSNYGYSNRFIEKRRPQYEWYYDEWHELKAQKLSPKPMT